MWIYKEEVVEDEDLDEDRLEVCSENILSEEDLDVFLQYELW